MEQKTEQTKRLTNHLLNAYGPTNIVVTDYWDGYKTEIVLAHKTKLYTAYIASW